MPRHADSPALVPSALLITAAPAAGRSQRVEAHGVAPRRRPLVALLTALFVLSLCAAAAAAGQTPTARTDAPSDIYATGSTGHGTLNDAAEPAQWHFEYQYTYNGEVIPGRTDDQSVPASTADQAVSAPMDTYAEGATYQYRLVVTTASGTAHGNWVTFTTTCCAPPPSSGSKPTPSGGTGGNFGTSPQPTPRRPTTGRSTLCHVPRLIGHSLKQARAILRRNACAIGRVRRSHHTSKRGKWVIVRQSRRAASTAPAQTKVDITLARR
jgi:hypothetical protein